jgi:hypothetical protein
VPEGTIVRPQRSDDAEAFCLDFVLKKDRGIQSMDHAPGTAEKSLPGSYSFPGYGFSREKLSACLQFSCKTLFFMKESHMELP